MNLLIVIQNLPNRDNGLIYHDNDLPSQYNEFLNRDTESTKS